MKKFFTSIALVVSVLSAGCMTRIETGEVGLRVDFNKQIQGTELMEGSWNQTLIGDVLTFPVRDVGIHINDRHPLTSENTPLGDFDLTVVYNINPTSVSDLWGKKAKAFHTFSKESGDWYLMQSYIVTMVDNASNKVVRGYKALEVNDNRQKIEVEIRAQLLETLKAENLQNSISFSAIQVKNAPPNQEILNTAIQVVRSQNELKVKENEVKIAEKEAQRMAALANNSAQSVAYMDAEARRMMAQAMLNGKVNTVVVPFDFKGFISVK
jgi:regulator of protease activity HflC (stomatin/prohibitin superfamily)